MLPPASVEDMEVDDDESEEIHPQALLPPSHQKKAHKKAHKKVHKQAVDKDEDDETVNLDELFPHAKSVVKSAHTKVKKKAVKEVEEDQVEGDDEVDEDALLKAAPLLRPSHNKKPAKKTHKVAKKKTSNTETDLDELFPHAKTVIADTAVPKEKKVEKKATVIEADESYDDDDENYDDELEEEDQGEDKTDKLLASVGGDIDDQIQAAPLLKAGSHHSRKHRTASKKPSEKAEGESEVTPVDNDDDDDDDDEDEEEEEASKEVEVADKVHTVKKKAKTAKKAVKKVKKVKKAAKRVKTVAKKSTKKAKKAAKQAAKEEDEKEEPEEEEFEEIHGDDDLDDEDSSYDDDLDGGVFGETPAQQQSASSSIDRLMGTSAAPDPLLNDMTGNIASPAVTAFSGENALSNMMNV